MSLEVAIKLRSLSEVETLELRKNLGMNSVVNVMPDLTVLQNFSYFQEVISIRNITINLELGCFIYKSSMSLYNCCMSTGKHYEWFKLCC